MPRGASFVGDFAKIVKVNSSGQVVLAGGAAARSTDVVLGVIAEGTSESPSDVGTRTPPVGSAVSIAHIGGGGILKVRAGASITAGQIVIPHASGTDAAGSVAGVADLGSLGQDQMGIGIAIESASAGDIFRFAAGYIAAPHTA